MQPEAFLHLFLVTSEEVKILFTCKPTQTYKDLQQCIVKIN